MRRLLSPAALLLNAAASTETGGGTTAKPATPPPSTTVPLSTADYEALVAAKTRLGEIEPKLSALTEKAKQAEDDLSHIGRLMRGEPNSNESIAHLMRRQGATDEQISTYLASLTTDDASTTPRQKTKAPPVDDETEDDDLSVLKRDLGSIKASQAKQERARLDSLLDATVKTSLDTSKDLSVFLGALSKISPEEGEGAGSRLRLIQEDVRLETLNRLRAKRASLGGNTWNDAWIADETKAAVKTVVDKLRTVVGDPSRLGRTPETSVGEDRFLNKQPVPAPTPSKGMSVEKAQAATREWAVDSLLRAASEQTTGKSAV